MNKTITLMIGAATLLNCSMTMAAKNPVTTDTLPVINVFNKISVDLYSTIIFNYNYSTPSISSAWDSLVVSYYSPGGGTPEGTVKWPDTDSLTFLGGYIYADVFNSGSTNTGTSCKFGPGQFVNNTTYNISVTYDQPSNSTNCTIETISS